MSIVSTAVNERLTSPTVCIGMGDLKTILRDLPKLKPAERERVRVCLASLKSNIVPLTAEPDDDCDQVLNAIVATLKKSGVEFVSVPRLRNSQGYRAFTEKVNEVMVYISKATTNKVQQRAILQLGVELLYRNLLELKLPATAYLLMAQIHRLPAVLNRAFPGYAESGLLFWVVGGAAPTRTDNVKSANKRPDHTSTGLHRKPQQGVGR